MATTVNKGREGESIAASYLEKKGYEIIKRNFHFGRFGEIDIIARDSDELVFVEVKIAYGDAFGDPASWITPPKIAKVKKAAEGYLFVNKIANVPCRFDAVIVDRRGGRAKINHIKNAF